MLVLILCIILNALIGVIFKLFEKNGIDNLQAIVVNYFVCVCTATVVNQGNPIPHDLIDQPWFWHAAALGLIFIIVFNLIALTVQNFGIVVSTIFQKISMIAPAIIAIVYYGESGGFIKWVGIFSSVVAIILLSYKKDGEKHEHANSFVWMFPILTFLGSCLIDSTLLVIEKQKLAENGDVSFTASLFLSAAINGSIILLIQILRGKVTFQWKNIIGGIALGIPNFFSIYLLLLALKQGWGGSVVFPANNVGVLLTAALFGIVIFKEKLTPAKIAGFLLAILSIVLITVF
ncbi:MAG: EamA family transporter [Saprospiraceae bacterium]|nr:EamA family transporter [Saprospiraceae bacterium]